MADLFSSSLGVSIPILVNHPRTLCACKKHLLGHLPDHVHCCQSMAASTQAHDWAVTQLKALFGSLSHEVRVQTAVTASRGKQRGDVQIRRYLHHNGASRDLVFDLTLTHERWGDTDDPHKKGQLRSPADLDRPLRDAAREKVVKYQSDYANDQRISFLPAAFSTSGRIHEEFLRLLFYHAHLESEEFFRLTGQLAQPNQDYVFSKRAAFFNSLKNKVGHVMARASALRVNLNLQPSAPLSLAPLPALRMLIFSMPLTSRTTSSLPVLAHERATSPLFQATAFAFRSFPPLLRPPLAFAPSSNKRHHHRLRHGWDLERDLDLV